MRGFFTSLFLAALRRSYKASVATGNIRDAISMGMTAIVPTITEVRARRLPKCGEVLTILGVSGGVVL